MKIWMKRDGIIAILGICLLILFVFVDRGAPTVANCTEDTEMEWQEEADSEVEEADSEVEVADSEVEEADSETEETETETDQSSESEAPASSWISELEVAKETTQILIVVANGTYATVSLHTQDANGIWVENFSVTGRVGKNGIGKEAEGDGKTPTGEYRFIKAFGIMPDPGISALPYLQVDETHHWVDDSNSQYYNQCVSTNDVEVDWTTSEKLFATGQAYHYALAINYNEACVPGRGSAIFLHCPSEGFGTTAGCIAIPEENMVIVMQLLRSDCVIIIDEESNVYTY